MIKVKKLVKMMARIGYNTADSMVKRFTGRHSDLSLTYFYQCCTDKIYYMIACSYLAKIASYKVDDYIELSEANRILDTMQDIELGTPEQFGILLNVPNEKTNAKDRKDIEEAIKTIYADIRNGISILDE